MPCRARGSWGRKPIIDDGPVAPLDLPFCPDCGKEVLPGDRFCLNCGRNLERVGPQPAMPQATYQTQPSALPPSSGPRKKNPIIALLLNLFLPGLGYVYNGAGRDGGQLVFGVLVFVFYFIGLGVSFAASLFFPPTVEASGISPLEYLDILGLMLPIAFAYDGYHRASLAS